MMRRFSVTIVFLGLILVGTALRMFGLVSAAPSRAVTLPPLQMAHAEADLRLAESRVLSFYSSIGDRHFEQAAAEVIELLWAWDDAETPRAVGILDHMAFVSDSRKAPELSPDSYGALILRIEAQADPGPVTTEVPELAALRVLPDGPPVLDAIAVKVGGTVRIACTAYDWERQMMVVKIADGWSLLLPPPAPYSRSRALAWFPQRAGSDKWY